MIKEQKIYTNETPTDKKVMLWIKNDGEEQLKNLKKYTKGHSEVEAQNRIQKLLGKISKKAKQSPELKDAFTNFLVTRKHVLPLLEDYVKHPKKYANKFDDSDDILGGGMSPKHTLKIMKKHPSWNYYTGGNCGEKNVDYYDENMQFVGDPISDEEKEDLRNTTEDISTLCNNADNFSDENLSNISIFFHGINCFQPDNIEMIFEDASDYYDDNYLNQDAMDKKFDKDNHSKFIYKNDHNKYMMSEHPQDKVNHGSYLIYKGINQLKKNKHSEKVIESIMHGFNLLYGIKPLATFKINFLKGNNSSIKSCCSDYSSKFWLSTFTIWLHKKYIDIVNLKKCANKYIKARKAMDYYDNKRKVWTNTKRKRFINKHKKQIKNIKHQLKLGVKQGAKKVNQNEKAKYFNNHKKITRLSVTPYIIKTTFFEHQPFSIEEDKDNPENNYFDITVKYNIKNHEITFTDNGNVDQIKNDLFGGFLIHSNNARKMTFNASNKKEIATDMVKFCNDIFGDFESYL